MVSKVAGACVVLIDEFVHLVAGDAEALGVGQLQAPVEGTPGDYASQKYGTAS
jgi:hypothetical protein